MGSKNEGKRMSGKTFEIRNAPLCEIGLIYHVFVLIFIGLFCQNLVYQYVKKERVNFGLGNIIVGFRNLDKAIYVWICCFVTTCIAFYVFKFWAQNRKKDLVPTKLWDRFWILTLATYYFYMFKFVGEAQGYSGFQKPCRVFLGMETLRLLMKVHSFVRNVAPRVLNNSELPKFSNYFYFLWAPTLIYRDEYPRTKSVNWKYALMHLLEVIALTFTFSFVVEIYMDSFHDFCLRKYTFKEIIFFVSENLCFSPIVFFCSFAIVLHSPQLFFAEILRFGDRQFYSDWWTATNFKTWMRKWNILVQDWLYQYLYMDFKNYVCDNVFLARFFVFFISFTAHEWVMYYINDGFCPLMFITFMGVIFPAFFVKLPDLKFLNIIVWCLGTLLYCAWLVVYTMEWMGRINSPLENPKGWEVVMPRFMICGSLF